MANYEETKREIDKFVNLLEQDHNTLTESAAALAELVKADIADYEDNLEGLLEFSCEYKDALAEHINGEEDKVQAAADGIIAEFGKLKLEYNARKSTI
jgi:hypothetical protein